MKDKKLQTYLVYNNDGDKGFRVGDPIGAFTCAPPPPDIPHWGPTGQGAYLSRQAMKAGWEEPQWLAFTSVSPADLDKRIKKVRKQLHILTKARAEI